MLFFSFCLFLVAFKKKKKTSKNKISISFFFRDDKNKTKKRKMQVFANFHYSYEYKLAVFFYIVKHAGGREQYVAFQVNIRNFLDCFTLMVDNFLRYILYKYAFMISVDEIVEFVADIPVNLLIPLVIPSNVDVRCVPKIEEAFELDEEMEYKYTYKLLKMYKNMLVSLKKIDFETPNKLVQIKNMSLGLTIFFQKLNRKESATVVDGLGSGCYF